MRETSSWGSPIRYRAAPFADPILYTSGFTPEKRGSRAPLLALAAAALVIAGIGLFLRQSNTIQDLAASVDLGGGLTEAKASELCLDFDSEFNLDKLRDDGILHPFGDPTQGRLVAVVETETLHAVCALSRRPDGEWFRAFSMADAHEPLHSEPTGAPWPNQIRIESMVGLDEGPLVVGRSSPDLVRVTVEWDEASQQAQIDDGWWASVFDLEVQVFGAPPKVAVGWATARGESDSMTLNENLAADAWQYCADEEGCRNGRLIELKELADASPTSEQSQILADDVVTEAEYRAVMASWGRCIADTTGLEVTIRDDGLFTVHGQSQSSAHAFEDCKAQYAMAVIEAESLLVWGEPEGG